MKTLVTSIILLIQLINVIQCQRKVAKDDDFAYRSDSPPRYQEYDKKMLESLLKEVISDELNKMKSTFDERPKEIREPKKKERAPIQNNKDDDPGFSSLMEEKVRLEKLRRKLEQEVTRRERIREERDREDRLREDKTRRELKRLEKLLAEAKSKIKDSTKSTSSMDRDRDHDSSSSDPLKLFSLKELDMLTDEAKFDGTESFINPENLMKDYMDAGQQVFDFPMIPSNDRPQFLPPEHKQSPPLPQFVPSPSSSNFMPSFPRNFNPNVHPPSFHPPQRPRHNPMHHYGARPAYPAFSPSMSRFPSPMPPPRQLPPIRIGGSTSSLSSMASSMYPSIYGRKSMSEEKEEKKPGKKIKSAIKEFAVSSILDVGMMSLMNNLLGKINAEPGTTRKMQYFY